jgi:hypothetical protein
LILADGSEAAHRAAMAAPRSCLLTEEEDDRGGSLTGSLLGHRVKEGKRVGWLSAQKQRREEKTIFL